MHLGVHRIPTRVEVVGIAQYENLDTLSAYDVATGGPDEYLPVFHATNSLLQ